MCKSLDTATSSVHQVEGPGGVLRRPVNDAVDTDHFEGPLPVTVVMLYFCSKCSVLLVIIVCSARNITVSGQNIRSSGKNTLFSSGTNFSLLPAKMLSTSSQNLQCPQERPVTENYADICKRCSKYNISLLKLHGSLH
jgi:hypothetical protein